jgi:hypothetical protein
MRVKALILGLTALTLGTAVAGSPASAAAGGRDGDKVYTVAYGSSRAGAGSVWFESTGDHLFLCDHQEDGRSVAVKIDYLRDDGVDIETTRWYTGGPGTHNGCKDVNINALEGSTVGYRVCLGRYSSPRDVFESSCSRIGGGIA